MPGWREKVREKNLKIGNLVVLESECVKKGCTGSADKIVQSLSLFWAGLEGWGSSEEVLKGTICCGMGRTLFMLSRKYDELKMGLVCWYFTLVFCEALLSSPLLERNDWLFYSFSSFTFSVYIGKLLSCMMATEYLRARLVLTHK